MNKYCTITKTKILFVLLLISTNTILFFSLIEMQSIILLNILLLLFYYFLHKNLTISKNKQIQTQNLFLRNIMHELKTPITKGKLVSDTLDNKKKKELLQKSFYRLEYLLEEFSKIEELQSQNLELNKKEFVAEELINQALDILQIDKSKIIIKTEKVLLNVDFKLFSIAIKNLIDNAIKYNKKEKVEILLDKESLTIKNYAEKLNKNINEYFKPFNREYESIEKGLGLGLYITKRILKLHNYQLKYQYKAYYHEFKIVFS